MTDSTGTLTCARRFFDRESKDIKSLNFWRAVVAEYIGTLVLCMWSIGGGLHHPDDGSPPDLLSAGIGTGFVVAVLINSLLNVSGGNINPAISIGFLVTGKITCVKFVFYVIVQCLACLSAVGILYRLVPMEMVGMPGLVGPGPGVTNVQAFIIEFCITFLLLFVTAALTDDKRTDNVAPVPFYVGLVVTANILFFGRTSGACMNPARSFGPAIVSGETETQWVYWLGPLLGGAAGALVYDKLLSVKAMTRSICDPCCAGKSRDSSKEMVASINENEKERMLTTET